jgi:hypothetical protein
MDKKDKEIIVIDDEETEENEYKNENENVGYSIDNSELEDEI